MVARRQEWEHGTVFGYDKRDCRCDACRLARREYDQALYASKRDLRLAQDRAWRDANCDKVRAQVRRQYAADPERAKAWKAKSEAKLLERDPDYRKRIGAKYDASPKGRLKNLRAAHKRRGVITDEWTNDYIAILIGDLCSYCGGPGGTVDHIVPVSAGGTSEWHNLTAACLSCNSSKGDSQLIGFLSRKAS